MRPYVFLGGWSVWCVSVLFVAVQVLGNWKYYGRRPDVLCLVMRTSWSKDPLGFQHGYLSSKVVISTPWEAIFVDLVGLYTLKGLDRSAIDFMTLTMINPISSWFEIVELLLVSWLTTKSVNRKEKVSKELIFDKSSNQIAWLVNKTIWLCRYPRCGYLIYDNGLELKLHFETLCKSYGINVSQPRFRIHKRMPSGSASIRS